MLAKIIFARSHSLSGLLIRHHDDGSKRRWSHTGVLIDAQPERGIGPLVWEVRPFRSFRATALDAFVKRYAAHEVVTYDVPYAAAGMAWLEKQEGTPYALMSVLGRVIGLHIDQSGAHCTEAIEGYLAACGVRRWRDGLHLITPNAAFNNLHGVL